MLLVHHVIINFPAMKNQIHVCVSVCIYISENICIYFIDALFRVVIWMVGWIRWNFFIKIMIQRKIECKAYVRQDKELNTHKINKLDINICHRTQHTISFLFMTNYFYVKKTIFLCHLYYHVLLLFLLYLWRHRNIHINYHVHDDRSYMVCIYTPTYKRSILRGKVCHNYNNTCQKWKITDDQNSHMRFAWLGTNTVSH